MLFVWWQGFAQVCDRTGERETLGAFPVHTYRLLALFDTITASEQPMFNGSGGASLSALQMRVVSTTNGAAPLRRGPLALFDSAARHSRLLHVSHASSSAQVLLPYCHGARTEQGPLPYRVSAC